MSAGMVLVFGSTVERLLRSFARRTGTGQALRRAITALVRTGTVVVLLHGWVLMWVTRHGVEDNAAKFALALALSWLAGLALLATPCPSRSRGRAAAGTRCTACDTWSPRTPSRPRCRASTASERTHP